MQQYWSEHSSCLTIFNFLLSATQQRVVRRDLKEDNEVILWIFMKPFPYTRNNVKMLVQKKVKYIMKTGKFYRRKTRIDIFLSFCLMPENFHYMEKKRKINQATPASETYRCIKITLNFYLNSQTRKNRIKSPVLLPFKSMGVLPMITVEEQGVSLEHLL